MQCGHRFAKNNYRLHLILKDRNRGGITANLAEAQAKNQWVMLDFLC